jgi:superfamily II DNA helicase RecQ
VVSPIIALIKDQIEHLSQNMIVAESINHKMGKKDLERVMSDLQSRTPKTKLLYVTAEQCSTKKFKDLLDMLVKSGKLAYFVIDEAHCVSMWGTNFRPDYYKLGLLKGKTGTAPWVALTATASPKVSKEIVSCLMFRVGYKTFKLPCFRQNLFYDVTYKDPTNVSFKGILSRYILCLLFRKMATWMT